jgi:predicted transcriptional regulator
MRANAAGTIMEILGLDHLTIPRYAAACPLWALFQAQQSPNTVIRQRALFPSGDRFIFVAHARNTGPLGFGKIRHYVTDMLVMSESDATLTVYAPAPSTPVDEVGPSCRLCPRRSCDYRVEDPLT